MTGIRVLALAAASLITVSAGSVNAGSQEDGFDGPGAWNAAYAAGDWAALRALYADDAWQLSEHAPAIKGADAIIAALRRDREQGAKVTYRFEPEDARVDPSIATVVAQYWIRRQVPGRARIDAAGRILLVYRKVGRRYLLWRAMDNTAPDVTRDPPR